MKVSIASDLHLEFAPLELKNTDKADVLILAGDICTAKEFTVKDSRYAKRYHDFFDRVCSEFPVVLYVMGNHEHYGYDVTFTQNTLEYAIDHPNIFILENDAIKLDDVIFAGATLWTDYNAQCPITMQHCKWKMSDHEVVDNSNELVSYKVYPKNGSVEFRQKSSKFTPEYALQMHLKSKNYFDIVTSNSERKYVIISHHSPTFYNVSPEFADDYYGNGAYCSNMDDFIMDRPQIKMWISGHIHNRHDYMMCDTRMIGNPRGYHGHESMSNQFQLKTVEV